MQMKLCPCYLPPLFANTLGQRPFSRWKLCQSGAGTESLCNGAALSQFSLLLLNDRILSTQSTLSTEVQDSLQIDVTVTRLCLESSCLWGGLKTNRFPVLVEKVELFPPPPPRVNSNRTLVGRHNGWTWEPFKFCFLHWGKEFVLVSELLLEMRTRKAKLGLVIRQVSALS